MLDIKLIREDPEPFRTALARRGLADRVDQLLAADVNRRHLTQRVAALRAPQTPGSRGIGRGQGDEPQGLIEGAGTFSAELKELEPQLSDADTQLSLLL